MLRLLFIVTACALCQGAAAGAIYKCHEGARVSYGDRPCPVAANGAELKVNAAPAPDPDTQARFERARAAVQEREQARAEQSLREQRADELAEHRVQRAAITLRKRCDKLRLQRQWADQDLARSRGEAREPARINARRQAETLALECPA